MPTTFSALATTTVGSGGIGSITFSSIPGVYTDLMLLISGRATYSNGQDCELIEIQFNGSSANLSGRRLYAITPSTLGTGSSPTNGGGIDVGPISAINNTANVFGTVEVYIPNYASSNFKTISAEGIQENQGAAQLEIIGNIWSNTSAITSITLLTNHASNFVQHTTATLYGIKNT